MTNREETFFEEPVAAPRGAPFVRVLVVTDGEGTLCAVDFAGYETRLARLMTRRFGMPFEGPGGLDRLFPEASVLAGLAVEDLAALGVVRARAASIIALARHVEDTPGWRDRYAGLEAFETGLTALPGIGPWTAQYIAMRGFGEPDAFPSADLGLIKAARALGIAHTSRELARHAERWRPWRSYAAQALWNYNPRDAA